MNNNNNIKYKINNHKKKFLDYYILGFLLLIFFINCSYLTYNHLLEVTKEKSETFIEGSCDGILNIIATDLKLILSSHQNITRTSLIKNYAVIKKQVYNNNSVIGNVISVNRKGENVIIDLQPITSLVHSILNKNFFYKIIFNANTIISNIEDREFVYSKTRRIDTEHSITVKLDYKPTSLYLQKYREEFNNQFLTVVFASGLSILLIGPILFYFTKKKYKLKEANTELLIAYKAAQLNISYIKNCQQLEQQSILPIILSVKSHNCSGLLSK